MCGVQGCCPIVKIEGDMIEITDDYGDMIKYVDEYVNQLTQELIKDCKKIEDILTQPLTK